MRVYVVEKSVLPCVIEYLQSYGGKIITWDEDLNQLNEQDENIYVQQPPPVRHRMVTSLLNIEQLSRKRVQRWILSSLSAHSPINTVIDYSPANLLLLRQHVLPHVSREVITRLEPFVGICPFQPTDVSYLGDVAFVGALSPRRACILDKLRERNLSVVHVKEWGASRDQIIARCRILLNIHYADDYQVFESFRCAPWLPYHRVVSETSIHQEEEPLYESVIWCDYKDLVEACCKVIRT